MDLLVCVVKLMGTANKLCWAYNKLEAYVVLSWV